jgi:hypothetical protein
MTMNFTRVIVYDYALFVLFLIVFGICVFGFVIIHLEILEDRNIFCSIGN